VLRSLHELIRRHVFDADRVHGDETTVPVLATGKTGTERLSPYLRDDRPFCRARPAGGGVLLLA
jgi:transposase